MHNFSWLFPRSRLKIRKLSVLSRSLSGKKSMRILNVAEKNDAAKSIAGLLSAGTATRREGVSQRNKIYEFDCEIFGGKNRMIMTSVSGHLQGFEFSTRVRNWNKTDPIKLFEIPVRKVTIKGMEQIKRNLEKEIRYCSKLIIWTDCDREGENIGFEIIEVCKAVKRDVEVHRAVFSELTSKSVQRALQYLKEPNKDINSAVNVRQELDLRIGAAFTRLQTVYLRKAFPNVLNENMISYGSCQFPTLGFVVNRFKAISEFKPEPFWLIKVKYEKNDLPVNFNWKRTRLFEKLACEVLYDKCAECGTAIVKSVTSKPKSKWRPKPLDTIELEKLASKKLRITAKEALKIAENLYTQGLISYPRTETNMFSKDIKLVPLVESQTNDPQWGEFARKVLTDGPNPFQGKKSDQAHPPIHPTKYTNELKGNDKRLYELIVRHFLACLSKHAEGLETIVEIEIAEEKFSATGLIITAKNYLEVYPYEKWSDKEIPDFKEGETFKPEIAMEESETCPPELLTEADLIALMEKHGIGTDATHAEHIETIKERLYVGLQVDKYIVPRTLGMGLVEGYNKMGYDLTKPSMRAELEADLKRICDREKAPDEVLKTHIEKYKKVFEGVQNKMSLLSESVQNYIEVEATAVSSLPTDFHVVVGKCPGCHSDMLLKKKENGDKFIGCSDFPRCCVVLWLPSFVLSVSPTNESCPVCAPGTPLLRFKFKRGTSYLPHDYVGCIGGCDWNLLEMLNCQMSRTNHGTEDVRSTERKATPILREIDDSGFASLNDSSSGGFYTVDSQPNCCCGIPARNLTVRKRGPNCGREFYKCSSNPSKCNFFLWKEPPKNIRPNERRGTYPSGGRKRN